MTVGTYYADVGRLSLPTELQSHIKAFPGTAHYFQEDGTEPIITSRTELDGLETLITSLPVYFTAPLFNYWPKYVQLSYTFQVTVCLKEHPTIRTVIRSSVDVFSIEYTTLTRR